jgi:hypothetical protein
LLVGFIPITGSVHSNETGDLFSASTQDENMPVDHTSINPEPLPQILANGPEAPPLGAELVMTRTNFSFVGYNLFVLQRMNRAMSDFEEVLFITDMDGNVILERKIGDGLVLADHGVEFINATHILLGDRTGAALYDIADDIMFDLGFNGHHEYEYNARNNTVFTFKYNPVTIDEVNYVFDYIHEYDLTGNLVWSLDTQTFIAPSEWCDYEDFYPTGRDIVHSNTIFYDEDEDAIYYNARNTNTFYKIDHQTGDLLWAVGEYGDFTMYNIRGEQVESLFYHAHAVEKIDENSYIIFDNDLHNETDITSRASQILEIEINNVTMTANVTWSWTAPEEYWTLRWGDADKLPNGNRLGTFGTEIHPANDLGARLVEVDESGRIVWEMSFKNTDEVEWGIYRSERVRFAPVLSSPDDLLVLDGDSAIVDWQAWYNFRPKRQVPGTFTLYLNGVDVDSGAFSYDKYWRPTDLSFDLGVLPLGHNNVTLLIADEASHTTVDTVDIFVGSFGIQREGPETIELGMSNTSIRWMGITDTTLHCNITANNTLQLDFDWTGSDFSFDLATLDVGGHFIVLEIYNTTHLVYSEVFWVEVHENAIPSISERQDTYSVQWNQTIEVSWIIEDASPFLWRIYLSGTLYAVGLWTNLQQELNWTLPTIDEGTYLVVLVLEDLLGQRNASYIEVTIRTPHPAVISSYPGDTPYIWGQIGLTLEWEIHGGTYWYLFRNGTEISNGLLMDNHLVVPIGIWQIEGWRLGHYNLTLGVHDSIVDATVFHTTWIEVIYSPGDAYANEVVYDRTTHTRFPDDAIGPPDNTFAEVYFDYGNGRLEVDMGLGEEIINGDGADFIVHARGGTYIVYGRNRADEGLTHIGQGTGETAFDIDSIVLDKLRYLAIELYLGDGIEVDAIEALNYNKRSNDTIGPSIGYIDGISVVMADLPVTLNWDVYDETPWSSEIYVDAALVNSSPWLGNPISFVFNTSSPGVYTVRLVLQDVFDNNGSASVIIRVGAEAIPDDLTLGLAIAVSSISAVALIAMILNYRRKRQGHGGP